MTMNRYITIEDIDCSSVSAEPNGRDIEVTLVDAHVDQILDTIGEDTVREYFNIEETA